MRRRPAPIQSPTCRLCSSSPHGNRTDRGCGNAPGTGRDRAPRSRTASANRPARITHATQCRPAARLAPCAVAPDPKRSADATEDGAHGGVAAFGAVAGTDADRDRVDLRERRSQRIQHGGGQAGHGTRAGRRETVGPACRGVQRRRESGHEIAPVGQIDIVRAAGQRCLRDAIVLMLERPGGVDDEIGRLRRQCVRKVCGIEIERDAAADGQTSQFRGECGGAGAVATGDDQFDIGPGRNAATDARAEIAVAADDEDAKGHPASVAASTRRRGEGDRLTRSRS
jgi:hypothetical protein